YGILALNYLGIPCSKSHGIPVLTVGRLSDAPLAFYPDHPPLVPLLISPLYWVFGVGEWQTRLVTSIATVLAIAVLYVLVRRFGNRRTALTTAALFAASPMVLHFGGQAEVLGMPLVLFALLTIHAYLSFHREPGGPAFARLIGAFVGRCRWRIGSPRAAGSGRGSAAPGLGDAPRPDRPPGRVQPRMVVVAADARNRVRFGVARRIDAFEIRTSRIVVDSFCRAD